ncbi:uncharacterized protein LOC124139838 [Haliotis rufescens]|uniref:uncharacterized protein LOC124139838 n=1 Tax=Haliotis rufescens TaxID=6454 RepID=UPI00201EC722|nr:uncharacterized protein LOC124139838 [Haliotis rufescens]
MARVRKLIRLFLALSVAGAIATIMVARWITPVVPVSPVQRLVIATQTPPRPQGFLVDTPACRIPNLDPFDSSISRFIRRRGKILCYGKPSITYEDGNVLRINWTTVNDFYEGDFKYCKYQPITRGKNQSDFQFFYGKFGDPFYQDVEISDEFLRIYCISKSEGTINTNFHSLIIPKEAVDERCEKNIKRHVTINKPKEIMNVLMVGVDSLSRLNFMRQMPMSRTYLLEDLEAIEMLGYTKVADNTFVNIVPMTTGKFVAELPWNETMSSKPFDGFNFIWKNFSNCGYRTLYAEDAPKIAIFTYLKEGFHIPPADYYNRVFSIAMEKHKSVWNHDHNCVGDRLETDMVLKYAEDFSKLYRDKPHFGFTFITRLSHDNVNDAGAADDPHFRYLQRIHKSGLLEKTMLIYFSDHGNRYGNIRNTFVGKLEERLPFIFFVLPRWFKKKYPQLIKNMKKNSHRLTTPFDVYETLKDILYFDGNVQQASVTDRGISLFSEVPRDRSCDTAAILPHWCMCLERQHVPVSSVNVTNAAKSILNQINEELFYYGHLCEVLEIQEIKEAVLMSPNKRVLHFEQSLNDVINRTVHYGNRTEAVLTYQLTFVTSPGGGLFEGTVNLDETTGRYTTAGDISRINRYGDQSICIDNFYLKKYCYCKSVS